MRTFIYVDAFNLYYGALKGTRFKWLNIERLCENLLRPENDITSIKYFTARVSARPDDPSQPTRQQAYLRALRTLPNMQIIFGHFKKHKVILPKVVSDEAEPPEFVEVIKTEEKGSDVNLATHLIHDAHLGNFEVAVIISNDSDLLEPIKIVRNELGKIVGTFSPYKAQRKGLLQQSSSFTRVIRKGALEASQFPVRLTDGGGEFHKPDTW